MRKSVQPNARWKERGCTADYLLWLFKRWSIHFAIAGGTRSCSAISSALWQ